MYSMPLFVWETKEKKSMDVFVNAQNYQKQLPTGETGGWGQDLRKAFFSLNKYYGTFESLVTEHNFKFIYFCFFLYAME